MVYEFECHKFYNTFRIERRKRVYFLIESEYRIEILNGSRCQIELIVDLKIVLIRIYLLKNQELQFESSLNIYV